MSHPPPPPPPPEGRGAARGADLKAEPPTLPLERAASASDGTAAENISAAASTAVMGTARLAPSCRLGFWWSWLALQTSLVLLILVQEAGLDRRGLPSNNPACVGHGIDVLVCILAVIYTLQLCAQLRVCLFVYIPGPFPGWCCFVLLICTWCGTQRQQQLMHLSYRQLWPLS